MYTKVIPTGLYAALCQVHVQAYFSTDFQYVQQTTWRMFEEHMSPGVQLWHIAKCDNH